MSHQRIALNHNDTGNWIQKYETSNLTLFHIQYSDEIWIHLLPTRVSQRLQEFKSSRHGGLNHFIRSQEHSHSFFV